MDQFQPRALSVLRTNIEELARIRGLNQTDLSFAVGGKDKSWINKILNNQRGLPLKHLDKLAGVLGVETYQLFQPGLVRRSERRSGTDRRLAGERRIGTSGRIMLETKAELDRVRTQGGKGPHVVAAASPVYDDPEVRRLTTALAARIDRLSQAESRRQAPVARGAQSATRARARGRRGSDPRSTEK